MPMTSAPSSVGGAANSGASPEMARAKSAPPPAPMERSMDAKPEAKVSSNEDRLKLTVNSENLNFVERDADFELLVSRVRGMRSRREFFNLG